MDNSRISLAIVDDETLIVSLLKEFLDREDDLHIIHTAASGTEFLGFMKKTEQVPDIVLMDLRMKGLDGVETTIRLKEQWPDVKVISVSSYYKKSFMGYMLKSGVSAFLPKGLSPEKLVSVIREVHNKSYYFLPEQMDVMREQFAANIPKPELERQGNILSDREKEILLFICRQMTAQEIAEKLNVSKRTVDGHRNNIFLKTGVKNLAGLVLYAIKYGIIDLHKDNLYLNPD
ncbi:MAG: response regulator [Bacteroidota bacterium]